MRPIVMGVSAFVIALSSGVGAASDLDPIGFPSRAFALTWSSLPTGHFAAQSPTSAPVRMHGAKAMPVGDDRMRQVFDAAFVSAAADFDRRGLAFDEMMTPWPQPQRWAFQRLRDAQAAYAPGDAQQASRFAALVGRVADGSGRSAAVDGSAATALDTAYAAALSRQDDGVRARTEAAQKAFVAYRDAFAGFADARTPGMGTSVAAELDRQRAADLGTGAN